ncbi:hypothetical protein O6P43_014197 [Quillaja saponaria]|uniref:Uncharacterized protein n=1 Tax=Quillaja saponaria TaxID=32244 RepID=A0AAD7LUM2_QUISA|nr:hypothetical protein O6P43_014197 [Quillaja saponaria]
MKEMPDMEWSNGRRWMIEEQAKKELQLLETQHPNHFEYLKLELKSFIFLHQSQPENNFSSPLSIFSIADTQESTSMKQRKMSGCDCEFVLEDKVKMEGEIGKTSKQEYQKVYLNKKSKRRRDRAEVVLERAQACLKKIRHLKTSLLVSSPN